MNKQDLIVAASQRSGVNPISVESVFDALFQVMEESITHLNERVVISGVGVFESVPVHGQAADETDLNKRVVRFIPDQGYGQVG